MQINQANLQALFIGYRALYMEAWQGAEPVMGPLALTVPSSAKIEQYNWLGAIPGMKELITEIQLENLTANLWQIVNKEWENTIAVKQFDIETDTYNVYNPLFSAMGLVARQHMDELLSGLLYGGFSNLCYDGVNFFSPTGSPHQAGTQGSYYNMSTAPLSQTAFRSARDSIMSRVNTKGRSMALGRKLQLVVPPNLQSIGRSILVADTAIQANADGSAVAAVTNIDKGTAELMVVPQLITQSSTAWYLLEQGYPYKPFAWQNNKAPTLTALTSPDSDHVFKRHEFLYGAYGRYNAGYLLPELACGSAGTGDGTTF